jgi:hypothetical protein
VIVEEELIEGQIGLRTGVTVTIAIAGGRIAVAVAIAGGRGRTRRGRGAIPVTIAIAGRIVLSPVESPSLDSTSSPPEPFPHTPASQTRPAAQKPSGEHTQSISPTSQSPAGSPQLERETRNEQVPAMMNFW